MSRQRCHWRCASTVAATCARSNHWVCVAKVPSVLQRKRCHTELIRFAQHAASVVDVLVQTERAPLLVAASRAGCRSGHGPPVRWCVTASTSSNPLSALARKMTSPFPAAWRSSPNWDIPRVESAVSRRKKGKHLVTGQTALRQLTYAAIACSERQPAPHANSSARASRRTGTTDPLTYHGNAVAVGRKI